MVPDELVRFGHESAALPFSGVEISEWLMNLLGKIFSNRCVYNMFSNSIV